VLPRDHSIADRTGRPLVASRYVGPWLVLLAALPVGLYRYYTNPDIGLFSWRVGESTAGAYMGVNYHVYHVAAEQALAGEPFYGVAPHEATGNFVYLYPPITVPAFFPFTALEWTTGYTVFTVLTVLAGAVATVVIVRYVEGLGVPLGWVDVALVFALFVVSIHVTATIYFGNINVLLGLAFAVGFWALSRQRDALAGAAFAGAALFKLFPALVGLWLLRDRRYTAVATALATGVLGLLAGALLFGLGTTEQFFTSALSGRTDPSAFVGGYPAGGLFYVTVQRPLSHVIWALWPDAPYTVLPISALILCGGVLAYFYREVQTQRERVIAAFVTVVITLLVVPSFRLYAPLVFPPLIALLYTWDDGPGRYLFVAGGVLFSVAFRPSQVIAVTEQAGPFSTVLTAVGTVGTLQLYAYGLMIGACAWHLHCRRSNQDASHSSADSRAGNQTTGDR